MFHRPGVLLPTLALFTLSACGLDTASALLAAATDTSLRDELLSGSVAARLTVAQRILFPESFSEESEEETRWFAAQYNPIDLLVSASDVTWEGQKDALLLRGLLETAGIASVLDGRSAHGEPPATDRDAAARLLTQAADAGSLEAKCVSLHATPRSRADLTSDAALHQVCARRPLAIQ